MSTGPSLKAAPDRGGIDALAQAIDQLNTIILGKEDRLRLAIACLLARGHLLIEDLPGVGKTTLAHALARVAGPELPAHPVHQRPAAGRHHRRVDLRPRQRAASSFIPGRSLPSWCWPTKSTAPRPKAQSALLEAMEEQQVTVDGETHALPDPFFVDRHAESVAPDRHLSAARIAARPFPDAHRARLSGRRASNARCCRARDRRDLLRAAGAGDEHRYPARTAASGSAGSTSPTPLLDYVQALVAFTRDSREFQSGLSPRAAISLLRAAQAWAMLQGHRGVLPEDVQAVTPAVIGHRLRPVDDDAPQTPGQIGALVLEAVAVP